MKQHVLPYEASFPSNLNMAWKSTLWQVCIWINTSKFSKCNVPCNSGEQAVSVTYGCDMKANLSKVFHQVKFIVLLFFKSVQSSQINYNEILSWHADVYYTCHCLVLMGLSDKIMDESGFFRACLFQGPVAWHQCQINFFLSYTFDWLLPSVFESHGGVIQQAFDLSYCLFFCSVVLQQIVESTVLSTLLVSV